MNLYMNKYADLILSVGLNITNGDKLYITCPCEGYKFGQLLVARAYELGASKVIIDFKDDMIAKLKYTHEDVENFKQVDDYVVAQSEHIVDNNFKILGLTGSDPNVLKGVDQEKIVSFNQAFYKSCSKRINYTMGDYGSWTVAAIATTPWAKAVFPDTDDAVELLWDAIFKVTRCYDEDPTSAWRAHINKLTSAATKLNQHQFDYIHFKNNLGTDLKVGLVKNHIWCAAESENVTNKTTFTANLPTEEVFTMPHKYQVNGRVQSTKPLNYNGSIIDDFYIEFTDGRVTAFDAKVGLENLTAMINMDEGAHHLGEVALVEVTSPINKTDILFYNTLFDENAACHLALGRTYPTNIVGGNDLTEEQKDAVGCNESSIHVDFMFGSDDMSVIGYNDKEAVDIMKNGLFV